ncbi:hypothetical protein Mal4_51720 [Maioricimonas rarisocia]|uniref:Uncharacterized protein n=1 Tax=Maioricimonas rarisocia TaxID=2528026 RepID=A0A517ZEA4_9PLAN|nr:hypothetical protein Mal4_51720 [Maioricimonas rarisocia]
MEIWCAQASQYCKRIPGKTGKYIRDACTIAAGGESGSRGEARGTDMATPLRGEAMAPGWSRRAGTACRQVKVKSVLQVWSSSKV